MVSLDGTLISKGGVMTGGMSRNLESRAKRWDEKLAGSLKEVLACLLSCLAAQPCNTFFFPNVKGAPARLCSSFIAPVSCVSSCC